MSREYRRAKTDRLDTEMLIRVFLGWLRGEPRHCQMVAIPTLEEEDARRPSRERESLVGERTRMINRMKAALIRLGIRGFKPELHEATALEARRGGRAIPPNMLDECGAIWRDWLGSASRSMQSSRLGGTLEQAPSTGRCNGADVGSIIGVGVETADMLVQEILSRNLRDRRAVLVTLASRVARRERVNDVRRAWRRREARAAWLYSAGVALPAVPEG